jgi:hypothetical protein
MHHLRAAAVSIEAMAMVLHHSRAKGTAKLVLLGIANHQGDGGAWPSHATLARYANVDERNVRRAIGQLEGKGELRRDVQAGGTADQADHHRPNRYDVLVVCPPWCDRSMHHRDTRKLSGRQIGLWIDRGAPTPRGGGSAPRGRAPVSPGGGADTPPKPSIEPHPPELGTAPQHARELDSAPCLDCGKPEARCQGQQRRWLPTDRHSYRPGGVP